MKYLERISSVSLELPDDLWESLEDKSESNIQVLIDNLENSVSNGWMGVAAEISDYLESSGFLDLNPVWRLTVEIERLKRMYDLGFKEATIEASNRTLNYLEQIGKEIDHNTYLLFRRTAIGHVGWVEKDLDKLSEIIRENEVIIGGFENNQGLEKEAHAFLYGLQGRLAMLKGDAEEFESLFQKGINVCDQNGFVKSKAHLEIIYAEHLMQSNDESKWKKASEIASLFISKAHVNQFKTHLLIRAVILLIEAHVNGTIENKTELKKLAFKYDILALALGIGQSKSLYPLLSKVKRILPTPSYLIDFYNLNVKDELSDWLRQVDWKVHWESLEELMKVYFEVGLKFKRVIKLPKGFPAFDLIAIQEIGGVNHNAAIQTKALNRSIQKDKIPDLATFQLAKEKLDRNYSIKSIQSVHWYSLSAISDKALSLLVENNKAKFGAGCETVVHEGIEKIVNFLITEPEILTRIYFSNEWTKTK